MNDGYISAILLVIILILLASGWRTLLFKDISPAALGVFFSLWIIGMAVHVELTETLHVQGIYLPLLLIVWAAVRFADWSSALLLILTALLTGLIGYFVQNLYMLDPALVVMNPQLDLALLLALLTYTVSRTPLMQSASLAIALIAGEIMTWRQLPVESATFFGGAGFQDLWWMSLAAVRATGIFIECLASLIQYLLKHFAIWLGSSKK